MTEKELGLGWIMRKPGLYSYYNGCLGYRVETGLKIERIRNKWSISDNGKQLCQTSTLADAKFVFDKIYRKILGISE